MTWALSPTPQDLQKLGDEALRELIIRCCEAELIAGDRSVAALQAGGNQNASDGGVDVFVDEKGAGLSFLPAFPLAIQVKAESMPAGAITDEMRPKAKVRPLFAALAKRGGAYVIASGRDNPSFKARETREAAMRAAVKDVPSQAKLHLAFYGAETLARWAGTHPGVALWLGDASGAPRLGWRPFDRWSAPNSPVGEAYVPDRTARARIDDKPEPVDLDDAMAGLRARLIRPGQVVRLVGLSGMGKTRFVQALFEADVGKGKALNPSLAVYCDVGVDGVTSPELVLEQLVTRKTRAVVVIDNCNHRLHRSLADIVTRPGGQLSLLTVDFDVADDQPEATYVVRLEPASEHTLEQLIAMRFPKIGLRSRERIAEVSHGNTRIALAIAAASKGVSIVKLNDRALWDRLFLVDRRSPDDELRRVAGVIALFGAIDVEAEGAESEIAVVCRLAEVSEAVFWSKLRDLLERGLAQQRGAQRAVLPQALAVWLAHDALERLSHKLVLKAVIEEGPARLALSFTKRLGELGDSEPAQALARELLKPGGRMVPSDLADDKAWRHFRNLAPLAQDRALAIVKHAVEKARPSDDAFRYLGRVRAANLLIDLAFDDERFEAAVTVLLDLMLRLRVDRRDDNHRQDLLALFQARWAATLASPARRFAMVERLIGSTEPDRQAIGVDALVSILTAEPRHHRHHSAFGNRDPEAGWQFPTPADRRAWFEDGIALALRLAAAPQAPASLRPGLARVLGGLIGYTDVGPSAIEALRIPAAGRFWREGWFAVCNRMYTAANHKRAPSKAVQALEEEMRPRTLDDRYEAWLLGDPSSWHPPTGRVKGVLQEYVEHAAALGADCAADPVAYQQVVPRALSDLQARAFGLGDGLARGAADLEKIWDGLVRDLVAAQPEERNITPLMGFLFEVAKREPDRVERWLEAAMSSPVLRRFAARLNTAPQRFGDSAGRRMLDVLREGEAPANDFRWFSQGPYLSNPLLAKLIRALLAAPDGGPQVAADALASRYYQSDKVPLDEALLQVGRETLEALYAVDGIPIHELDVVSIAKVCLLGPAGEASAKRLAKRLARRARHDLGHPYSENLPALIVANYPKIGLDAFLGGKQPLSSHQLDVVMLARDDDDHPDESPFGSVDGAAIREWVLEAPPVRAPRVAKVVGYWREADGKAVWTPLALWLLELPGVTKAVAQEYEMRFTTGSWSGSTANRYLRRLPLAEALLGHPNAEIAAWAATARDRLLSYVEEAEDEDRRSNARFE